MRPETVKAVAEGTAGTVTVQEADKEPSAVAAVMTAVPFPMAVTVAMPASLLSVLAVELSPASALLLSAASVELPSTAATSGSEEVQRISWVVASAGVRKAVRVPCPPTERLKAV